MSWTPGVSNGGSAVIDYSIYYGLNSGSYTLLVSGITTTTYTTTVTLVPGSYYKFTIQSRNSIGFSIGSSKLTIMAASVPNAPTNVLTQASGTNA